MPCSIRTQADTSCSLGWQPKKTNKDFDEHYLETAKLVTAMMGKHGTGISTKKSNVVHCTHWLVGQRTPSRIGYSKDPVNVKLP